MPDDLETTWRDYYEILQINPKADPEVVAGAYNRLAKKYHPDLGGDKARMQLLNEAYSVLSDPDQRVRYDIEFNKRLNGSQKQQTEPAKESSIWEILKQAAPDILQTILQEVLRPEAEPQRDARDPSLQSGILHDIWYSHSDNLPYIITHAGGEAVLIRVVDNRQNILLDGNGKFDGRHLWLQIRSFNQLTRDWILTSTTLQLSEDSRWLIGPGIILYR